MAYSIDDIRAVLAMTAASEYGDDIAEDNDVTVCMLNGTTGEDCDEWKEGTLNGRVEIDIPPSAITALSVGFYFNSVMTAGDQELLPYTDANSVSSTNAVLEDYTTPGQWIYHVTDGAFLAELGDLGGYCAVRLAAPAGAKSKIGEVNIDIVYVQEVLSGLTKDNDGVALGSCECACFKVETDGPPTTFSFIDAVISHVTTGAYSFDVWDDIHMVTGHKDGSPNVMDVTDKDLAVD